MSEARTHIGGYHGTSYSLARRILSEGFKQNGGLIHFAPLDEEGLKYAKEAGKTRAMIEGDTRFSVVEAAFGRHFEEEYDSLGRPQIEIPGDGSVTIYVRGSTLDFPTLEETLDVARSATDSR